MPNYKCDLQWLEQNHPDEFVKLPTDLSTRPGFMQLHCSVHDTAAGTDAGKWSIVLLATDDSIPDDEAMYQYVLGISRPDMDDEEVGHCQNHTLKVSRGLCPIHAGWKPVPK